MSNSIGEDDLRGTCDVPTDPDIEERVSRILEVSRQATKDLG